MTSYFYIPTEQDFLEELANGICQRFTELKNLTILLPTRNSCFALKNIFAQRSSCPKIITIDEMTDSTEVFSRAEVLLLLASLFPDESTQRSVDIAGALYELLMRLGKDGVNPQRLLNTGFGDVPKHVEEMVGYLKKLGRHWPALLKKHNRRDAAGQRNLQVDRLIATWQTTPPASPIIAAGSSGSIKSTARLLQSMAETPNCYVVLRGIDPVNDSQIWQDVDGFHPLFYLRNLIGNLDNLTKWNDKADVPSIRAELLREAMRPALMVAKWQNLTPKRFATIDRMTIIECQNQSDEAMIIASKLKEIAQIPGKKAGVIINNIGLVARVKSLLRIWNIEIFDTNSANLMQTQQIEFMRLILDVVSDFSPLNLLAVLKHDLYWKQGQDTVIATIEKIYLRGICNFISLAQLIDLVKEEEARALLLNLQDILQLPASPSSFADLLTKHITIAKTLTGEDLWKDEVGKQAYEALTKISTYSSIGGDVRLTPKSYWHLLTNLLQRQSFNPGNKSAQITFFDSVTSRLLHFDSVIMADLNEGSWPISGETDPWFNNSICAQLGLVPQENEIGRSAHDFCCLAQMPEVLMTRSLKARGSPSNPSRFLIRLETVLTKIGMLDKIKPPTHRLSDFAQQLFTPLQYSSYLPIAPKPCAELRPKEISVTSVERLMRDPYSYYAAKILKIKPLDPIDKDPDQSEFGNFVHRVIGKFNEKYDQLQPEQHLASLIVLAKMELITIANRPVIQQIWLPRFGEIAKWLVEFELSVRANHKVKIHSEIDGSIALSTKCGTFTLKARADRIEDDGVALTIIDFKTGQVPTQRDILTGHSSQLTLEALIAEQGGFNIFTRNTKSLLYAQLSSGSKLGKMTKVNNDLNELIKASKDGVVRLMEIYLDPNCGYLICPSLEHESSYNEYDHLERIDEWR